MNTRRDGSVLYYRNLNENRREQGSLNMNKSIGGMGTRVGLGGRSRHWLMIALTVPLALAGAVPAMARADDATPPPHGRVSFDG